MKRKLTKTVLIDVRTRKAIENKFDRYYSEREIYNLIFEGFTIYHDESDNTIHAYKTVNLGLSSITEVRMFK